MSLKVLWITSAFPADTESARYLYLWHSLEALKQMGAEPVVLFTPAWKPLAAQSINDACFPVEINTHRYLSIPRHYFRSASNVSYVSRIVPEIKKLNKQHQFYVIHAHGEISGLAAVKASQELNIPAVVTIHGIDMCSRVWSGFSGKMFRNMFNQANKIIFVGESLKNHFQTMLDNNHHSCVVYNGVRLPEKSELTDHFLKGNAPIRIISVSNLHEGKGIDLTLQALAKLKNKEINNWTYTIIGSGDQRTYLKSIAAQFDFGKQIEFIGDCSHQQVYAYLQKADIFCLPSYREAFGIAYLEAMVNGLLTIGVKGQGPQAFIEHGKTGFLVEPEDVDSLTKTLHFAMTQYQEIQTIAYSGQQYVQTNFTWEKHAEKLLSVYKEVYT